jgi:DNA-binding PadR family transcriptional regulator
LLTKRPAPIGQEAPGKRARHLYTITAEGPKALADAKEKVQGLFRELFEDGSAT